MHNNIYYIQSCDDNYSLANLTVLSLQLPCREPLVPLVTLVQPKILQNSNIYTLSVSTTSLRQDGRELIRLSGLLHVVT